MTVSSAEFRLHRTYLYAPGDRPDIMRKALASGADAVVLDLEDAVAPQRRPEARSAAGAIIEEFAGRPGTPDILVRLSRVPGGYSVEDLDAVVRPGLYGLRLPKAESSEGIAAVADRLEGVERAAAWAGAARVMLDITIESALGATMLPQLIGSSDRVARVGLGTSDLLADIGAVGDDDLATLHVRSELVLQSRAAGVGPPIDSVHVRLDDADGLRASARRARALGFFGKSVIHPRQIGIVHDVFTPSAAELEDARRIIEMYDAALREGSAVMSQDGDFIDAAIVQRARAALAIGEQDV